MFARSLMLNGNWETIISHRAFGVLFAKPISFMFPQLQKLTLKWFTGERLWSFVDTLQNLSQLIELDIRFLKGKAQDTLLTKVLAVNNGQLTSISFDQDSIYLNISEENKPALSSNIIELKINVTQRQMLFRFLTWIPNIRWLHVHLNEISDSPVTKQELANLPSLIHLIDFKLHSINLFWTFDELFDLLDRMPILQKLTLDLRTSDKHLINGSNLMVVLRSPLKEIHLFIRYYLAEQNLKAYTLFTLEATRPLSIGLLDEIRHRVLIYTIPCGLRSIILPGAIGKNMSCNWKYMQQVEDLWIYEAASLQEIFLIVQHFHRLRTLQFELANKSELSTMTTMTPPCILSLPRLLKLEVFGICELYDLISVAPRLNYLSIDYACLTVILNDEPSCTQLKQQITRLDVTDWIDIEFNVLKSVCKVFSQLHHLILTMKDSKVIIDSIVLALLAYWNGEYLPSIDIKAPPSDEASKNLRQWLIDNTQLTATDSFGIEYKDEWFALWL
ncbi:unnamed protein product [Rotaria sp. Silwood1]|nr:unnamed protein product [Rotaria sp. Silwood1]